MAFRLLILSKLRQPVTEELLRDAATRELKPGTTLDQAIAAFRAP